jgi:FkbM family methyltransferase
MEKYGLIYCIDPPPPPSAPTDIVICHFVWPIGNAKHKMGRMKPHVTHILRHFREIAGNKVFFEPTLTGTSYKWGSNGMIRLEANGKLVTTWATGTYKWLGEYSMMATWAGIDHFLRFNSDYTEHQSVRLGDLEYMVNSRSMEIKDDMVFKTFNTKYGLITLYKNEMFISKEFVNNKYWDEDTLLMLKQYIDPEKNIIEIGGHCGTSTVVYASFLNKKSKIYVYEPQKNMFNLLRKNIEQNKLSNIIPFQKGVFCFNGKGSMNKETLDGAPGIVSEKYTNLTDCNFGGLSLGSDGEGIELTTIDAMGHKNIGFIHCDAQGSENFIFSKGIELIKKNRPVILYENNELYGRYLYEKVKSSYPEYSKESVFNLE